MDSRTAFRSSEFEVACDLVSDVVITVGVDQVIRYANPSAERVLGWPPRELVGLPLSALIPTRFQAEQRGQLTELQRPMSSERGVRSITARRKDGVEVPLDATVSRALVHGELCFTLALRDVSERMQHEQEVKLYEERLSRIERLESLATMSAGIAHDFNNTLTVVLALTRAVRDELPAASEQAEDLGEVLKAATRASELTRRLLAFGRRKGGEVHDIDPTVPLNDVATWARSTAGLVTVETSIPPGLPLVHADESMLGQATLNLVTNALYAMKDGGRLALSAARVTVSSPRECCSRTLSPDTYLRIAVSDTGSGISPELLTQIFEPFFTTKPEGEGTGLGLAMVQGFVHAAGGAVDVRSTVGVGTVVELYLPVVAPKACAAAPAKGLAAQGRQRRILLVAEDLYVCAALQRGLMLMGHDCHCVSSPRDAWVILKADPRAFDVLVTDDELPAQSGLELAARAQAWVPGLEVVVLSDRMIDDEARTRAGVQHVLTKPTTALALDEVLGSRSRR